MRQQSSILASPVFLMAVAVLVVNDQFLKAALPSPVTGKASDFAGVVVVLFLFTVLVDRAAAAALTGLGFAALKTIPGVNEFAAPLLGGVTGTDPTDLIALIVIPALFPHLRRHSIKRRDMRWWTAPVVVIPAIAAAVLATTATSCAPPQMIVGLAAEDGRIFASSVDDYFPSDDGQVDDALVSADQWWASTDGRSWQKTDQAPSPDAVFSDDEFCLDDGSCLRTATNDRLSRCAPDGTCETAFMTGDSPVSEKNECVGGDQQFKSVIVVPTETRDLTVVAMGAHGVAFDDADGAWHRAAVFPDRESSMRVVGFAATSLLFVSGIIMGIWAIRRRTRASGAPATVAVVGSLVLALLQVSAGFNGVVATVLSCLVFAVAMILAIRLHKNPGYWWDGNQYRPVE